MKNDVFGYLNALSVLGIDTIYKIACMLTADELNGVSESDTVFKIETITKQYREKASQLAKDYEV